MTAVQQVPPRTLRRDDVLLLDAYAARSCPVKTQNTYDTRLDRRARPADDRLTELFDGGLAFEEQVLDAWLAAVPDLIDLRPMGLASRAEQVAASLQAMASGAAVILKARLPEDPRGHRTGAPDALVRGPDQPDGRPGYRPVEIKWHRIVQPDRAAREAGRSVSWSPLSTPLFADRIRIDQMTLRIHTRERDFLQLAHYHRLLEAAGHAAPGPRAGVIGTDELSAGPGIAWVDLDRPLVKTFSRRTPEGWQLRSILERYDHEHAFRVDIAEVARRQSGHPESDPRLLVSPIVVPECARCPWWEHCRPQLPSDDVSLRIDKGPLDPREIITLRRAGIATITDLAYANLEALLPSYLPEVSHRSSAETRLRAASRRARMLLDGVVLERETTGPIEVPTADVEVDVDIETSVDGRVYLWGFRVTDRTGVPTTHQFSCFADLDATAELELARTALCWLRDLVEGDRSVLAYHYSSFEVSTIRQLASRAAADRVLVWAADYAEGQFVDLLEIVKQHFFGASGLGLKSVARQAGFGWRDDDPGGLNSQLWFTDAVHGETTSTRASARRRVLEYNEDDVLATSRLRAWLREQ